MKTRRRYRRKSISKRRRRRSTKKKRRYRRKGTKKKKRRRRRRRGGEGDPPKKKRTLKRTKPRRVYGMAPPSEVDREMAKVVREFPEGIGQQRKFAPEMYEQTMRDARKTAVRRLFE